MKPLCIYHGNCADGFTAAWAVHRALGDYVDFFPGVHGNPPPDVKDRDVIMVDFSYRREALINMLRSGDENQANTILILDHHKTAAEDLAGLPEPEGSYDPKLWRSKWEQSVEWPVRCIFDMQKSGAQLAWTYFNPGVAPPALVEYVGDRDLWKFALPDSRDINAYIFANEYTFDNWDRLYGEMDSVHGRERIADMGGAIEKKHHKDVAELVSVTKRRIVIGGIEVDVANLPYTLTSDAGHLMSKGQATFAACYWDTPEGRVFSLRSAEDGLDVSQIAKIYGGGGHKNAAGFRMPIGWEGDKDKILIVAA